MKMAPRLLLLCLLGCVQLVLGAPINQRKDVVGLQKDYFEREEPFRLTADDGVRDEERLLRKGLTAIVGDGKGIAQRVYHHGGANIKNSNIRDGSTTDNTAKSTATSVSATSTSIPTVMATTSQQPVSTTTAPMATRAMSVSTTITPTASTSTAHRPTRPGGPTSPSSSSTSMSVSASMSTTTSTSPVSTSVSMSTSVPVSTSSTTPRSIPPHTSSSTSGPPSTTTPPTTTGTPTPPTNRIDLPLIIGSAAGGVVVVLIFVVILIGVPAVVCYKKQSKRGRRTTNNVTDDDDSASQLSDVLDSIQVEEDTNWPTFQNAEGDEYERGVAYFLDKHQEYCTQSRRKPQRKDLGSRMQKRWYKISTRDSVEDKVLTIAPVSQHCPLKLHKHQKGLNKLLSAIKVHPYLHSIELVDHLVDHELLVMVQPLMKAGSLKDMIYKATPLTNWSDKYAHRSTALPTEKIGRYGRQILEAMKFLYSKGFPMLGHVQSGNIFVVDDVCHLGGYENTLLGYRTRLFRLCKDELEHFDVILFGHVVFEMAAGYELTHLRPGQAEYKTVDKRVRPVLEYIFEEGFPHDINDISMHAFFGDPPTELSGFDENEVQLSDSMKKVLEKARKGKSRVQKSPKSPKPAATSKQDGTETLTAKLKSTLRVIVPKFGGSNDSEEDLEKKLTKNQKKLKKKSGKDVRGVDPTPLLDNED